MIVAIIWVASGYDSKTGVIFQMSEDTQKSVIKVSRASSKAEMQLDLNGKNDRPWNTSSLGNASRHSLVHQSGYMDPQNSSHLFSKAMTAHQGGGSESATKPSEILESLINSVYNKAVENHVASVVKCSIVAEPKRETFHTLEESNSTTITYSSTSFAPFSLLNLR